MTPFSVLPLARPPLGLLGSPLSRQLSALRLNRQERKAFEAVAGSRKPPNQRVRELWSIVGRGGGKSRISAAIAVFLACFQQNDLDPGEVGYILVLAASRDQASIVFNFASAFLLVHPF
jgi:hypothetical protein